MKTTDNGWNKAKILHLLDTNDRAVDRALIQIYRRQTASEQAAHTTTQQNGRGFNHADAKTLTRYAKLALTYGDLTPRKREIVRERIKKYWAQLLEIAATSPVRAPDA